MENIIIDKREYSIACKEVLEVLKKIKQEDLEKIPDIEIEKLKQSANENYVFTYDIHKNIKEQNVSKLAKAILANLFIDYVANEEQREKILKKQKDDLNLLEQEKNKKYLVNDVFASKRQESDIQKVSARLPAAIEKETLWNRILKCIRKVFKV